MRLRTCPACGEPSSGFFKLCGRCEETDNISQNQNTKIPHRPVGGQEDDE